MSKVATQQQLKDLQATVISTANRLHMNGWPQPTTWPPFMSRSRYSYANHGSGYTGAMRMRFIDKSGPWLGEDGHLYVTIGRMGAPTFRRWSPDAMTSEKRIQKITRCLERLERR